jgi:hypothetical protein
MPGICLWHGGTRPSAARSVSVTSVMPCGLVPLAQQRVVVTITTTANSWAMGLNERRKDFPCMKKEGLKKQMEHLVTQTKALNSSNPVLSSFTGVYLEYDSYHHNGTKEFGQHYLNVIKKRNHPGQSKRQGRQMQYKTRSKGQGNHYTSCPAKTYGDKYFTSQGPHSWAASGLTSAHR